MGRVKQIAVAFTACLAALVMGTMLSFTAPVIPWLEDTNSTAAPFHTDQSQSTWVAGLFPIGAFIGAIPAGLIVNTIGKKWTMTIFAIPFILAYAAMVIATNVNYLYGARFVQGFSTGILSTCIPTYIGEITEPAIRGTLGGLFQIFLTVGIFVTYCLGVTNSYLVLTITCTVMAFIYTCLSLLLPESPLYLLRVDKEAESSAVLKSLRIEGYDEKPEIAEMKTSLEASRSSDTSIGTMMTKANRRALTIGIGLQVVQQLCGINAVIFYTSTIFETAGASLSPTTCSILLGIVQIIATCLSASLTDTTGRKALLIASTSVMGISLAALGIVFYMKEHGEKIEGVLGVVPIISLLLFIIMFSIGMGPLPWIVIGEIFSPEIKGIGSSMAIFVNWFLVFMVTKLYPIVADAIGNSITFWIFAIICWLSTLWIIFGVLETKGKSLKQIQDELAK